MPRTNNGEFVTEASKMFTDSERRFPHPSTTTSRVQKRRFIFCFLKNFAVEKSPARAESGE